MTQISGIPSHENALLRFCLPQRGQEGPLAGEEAARALQVRQEEIQTSPSILLRAQAAESIAKLSMGL